MAYVVPQRCPSCGGQMHIKTLVCPACQTEISGDFPLDRFTRLSAEQFHFLETFLRCRGSLKDVGAELGISYPTARNRLDKLLQALGYESVQNEHDRRIEILTQLKNGEISAEDALDLLQGGKGND